MPPRSEAGVSTNETTNNQQNNSSSSIVNSSNNLIMSNQANSIHPNAGVQLNNNGLHQPIPHNSSHFSGGAYQTPPDLYGANKASLPPSPYAQPPSHWQGKFLHLIIIIFFLNIFSLNRKRLQAANDAS